MFFIHKRYRNTPSVRKKTTIVFSVAVRDKLICQGEILNNALVSSATPEDDFLCDKSSRTKKNVRTMVNVPKNAEAKRVEKGVSPNRYINGIDAYEYPAGL